MKILFKTSVNAIKKIRDSLAVSRTLGFKKIVILSNENENRLSLALEKINEAINILSEIK